MDRAIIDHTGNFGGVSIQAACFLVLNTKLDLEDYRIYNKCVNHTHYVENSTFRANLELHIHSLA